MAEDELETPRDDGAAPQHDDEPGAPARPASSSFIALLDPDTCLERAHASLAEGDALEALRFLERAHQVRPDDPVSTSLFGLLLAQERGQVRRAVELCRAALESCPERPEHFFHLAKVLLKAGEKSKAIDVLRSGMRAHPDDEQLGDALLTLGIRRPLLFKTLGRAHPLNRYTGLLLARLGLR